LPLSFSTGDMGDLRIEFNPSILRRPTLRELAIVPACAAGRLESADGAPPKARGAPGDEVSLLFRRNGLGHQRRERFWRVAVKEITAS